MIRKTFEFPCDVLVKTKKTKLNNLFIPYCFPHHEEFWHGSIQTNCLILQYDDQNWEDMDMGIHVLDDEIMMVVSITDCEKETRLTYYIVSTDQDNKKFKEFVLKMLK